MRTFCLRPGKLYSKGKYTDLEYHISFLHSLSVFLYFSPSFSVFFAFYLYILNFPFLSFLPVFFYFSSSLSIITYWIFLSCLLLFLFFIFVFFAYCPSFLFFSLAVLPFFYLLSYPSFLSYSLPFPFSAFSF